MASEDKITIQQLMIKMGESAKAASTILANAPTQQKNTALAVAADFLEREIDKILKANQIDLNNVRTSIKEAQETVSQYKKSLPEIKTNEDATTNYKKAEKKLKRYDSAFMDRLTLTKADIHSMAEGLRQIIELPEPVGRVIGNVNPKNSELKIERVAVPLGVIGIIYESRPNVTADAGALCLKSGNVCILRAGSESIKSSIAIHHCLQEGLKAANLTIDCIQLIKTTDRHAVSTLISMVNTIDVIVPRGGRSLVELIQRDSKVPVFSHLEGLNHIYLDQHANPQKAFKVIQNSKLRRTGVCGSLETLLIHADVAFTYGEDIIKQLIEQDCEIRGDDIIQSLDKRVVAAKEKDWRTEYLDSILSVRVVENLDEAIQHIATYGSGHTDCIITENAPNAARFLNEVDSAIVIHNASTQFADGGEFGMGAEIGISTGRMHARGPVGIEQLTTFKYRVVGNGTIRA